MIRTIVLAALFALVAVPPAQAPQLRSTHVTTLRGEVNSLAPTRDGKRIYFVRDSQLVMFERATGRETTLGEMRTRWGLDVSPAGDRLAFTRRSEDGRGDNAWTIALNPSTGHTTGTPARVSTITVDAEPVFSPDAKWLTLSNQQSLAIVPTSGGPERVIMRARAVYWPVRWAPDGKSIYAGVSFNEETAIDRTGIYRLPIDGGSPQLVVRTAGWGAYPGLSPDGKYLGYWKPDWDSVVVQTIGGRRVAAFVPAESTDLPEHWFDVNRGYYYIRNRPRAVSLRFSNPERTLVLPDTLGNPPVAVRWAPDGKRAAFISRSPRRLVIMNADGTVQRRFSVSENVDQARGMKWSPDGQRLLYPGTSAGIHVVAVTPGGEFHIPSGWNSRQMNPFWRSDSRAILYGIVDTTTGTAADSTVMISLRERDLAGAERVLRTVRAPNISSIKFASDSVAVSWQRNEYRAIPLRHSGDSRIVYTRDGAGQPVATFSENGLWMAVRVAVQGEQLPRRIDVMRIDGSERRTVQLNMTTLSGGENPIVSDDGRTLIVLGAVEGGFEYQRVDVATGRSTKLATFQTSDRSGFAPSGLSPDGRAVLFHTALPPYANLYEVDMSNILRAAGSVGGRSR